MKPWVCLGLLALVLVVFAPVRGNEFVLLDDPVYITSNPHVREGLTPGNVAWAFTTFDAANWHPLTWLSHMLDVEGFGLDAGLHHLMSVALHGVSSVLFFLALAAMTRRVWPSALAAALFAVHPLRVESVAWASERKDVLAGLFWMLALLAYATYARRPTPRARAALIGTYALGILAKPMVVTLPFVLLLLDVWPLKRWPGTAARRLLLEKVPLFALALFSAVLTVLAQHRGGTVLSFEAVAFPARVANAAVTYLVYLGKAVWPTRLAFFYPHPALVGPGGSPWLAPAIAAMLAVVALSVVAVAQRRKRPYLLVGWLWYLGTLVPVVGLVQVGIQARADRYTYLPLAGIFLIVAWGVAEAVDRRPRVRSTAIALSGIVLVAFGAIAQIQVRYWRDSATLYRHALAVTEDNYVAHNSLGSVLVAQGNLPDARVQLDRALAIKPDYALGLYNLGRLLEAQGDLSGARAKYEESLRVNPRAPEASNNLAGIAASSGDLPGAIERYEAITRAHPEFEPAHYNLGLLLARQGDYPRAEEALARAAELDPMDAPAHAGLGRVRIMQGRLREALACYERALALAPGAEDVRAEAEMLRESLRQAP